MPERIHLGPFITRRQAAMAAGVSTREVRERPDLLRIGGTHLEEVYYGFQFDRSGVRTELGWVVRDLRRRYSDDAIADWLVRPHATLSGMTPLRWLESRGHYDMVLKAAHNDPPINSQPEPPRTRLAP